MDFHKFIQRAGLESKDYQCEGVGWCIERENSTAYCRGGIIADEMGLGKTIMMIGTIIQNFQMSNLIVLPLVLVEQWKEQFQKTTGHCPLVYHGGHVKSLSVAALQNAPIVITTYGTLVSDCKRKKRLQQVEWNRIIFDEAHHLRNNKTGCYRAAMGIKSACKWLITGTPIQNHINDLYSLFDILGVSNKIYTKTDELRRLMSSIVLKRTKKSVGIVLPPVHTTRVCSPWKNDNEQKLTEFVHDNSRLDKHMLLAMMMYERMMCVYPQLISEEHLNKIRSLGLHTDINRDCGTTSHSKMDSVINHLVERKDNGNKKIIFTTFRGEIDHIQSQLTENGMSSEYIDGRITKKQRNKVLENSADVLILQIKTGNEGLNLQQYNEIYFVTPDWNPQTEAQAVARCHRIGQTRSVYVYRFVMASFHENDATRGNIEMYTETVQEKKLEMEKKVSDAQ